MVLLISDVPPTKKFSGSLLTYHLLKNISPDEFYGYYLVNPDLKSVGSEYPSELFQKKDIFRQKSRETSKRPSWLLFRPLKHIYSFLNELRRRYFEIPEYIHQIRKIIEEKKIDKVWIIIQGQTMIWIAEKLIKMGYPVYVQMWDHPNWWIKANNFDFFSKRMLKRSYEFCLQHCRAFASPSENMSKIYRSKYPQMSVPFYGVYPRSIENVPLKPTETFIIGIAGQIYATDTFLKLIDALNIACWSIDGRRVEIHYWGNSSLPYQHPRIIPFGYVDQDHLASHLQKCHILYCPYWFDRSYEEEAKTSFPSKLISYMNVSVPIFFHGPEYSSPVEMLRETKAAIVCTSAEPSVILMNLRKLFYQVDAGAMVQEGLKLVRGPLGVDQLRENFSQFLGSQP